jgi:hypothetical protein
MDEEGKRVRRASHSASTAAANRDPLADIARCAQTEAATACAGQAANKLAQLEPQCEAAGLGALAQTLRRRLGAERTPHAALATAYLASETLATLNWS